MSEHSAERDAPGYLARKAAEIRVLDETVAAGAVRCSAPTTIPIAPMDVNCPICAARAGQSCQEVDGFVEPAHASRQVAAITALATGEYIPSGGSDA